uniref:Secreted protein n=1 Tax=Panstrongylus lignarius TaxID=156445 RepID=A0A224XRS2_9HEMI
MQRLQRSCIVAKRCLRCLLGALFQLTQSVQLLSSNICWFVQYDPDCSLPTSGMCCGPIVSHVMFCIWQQTAQRQMTNWSMRSFKFDFAE